MEAVSNGKLDRLFATTELMVLRYMYVYKQQQVKHNNNKKVLLRERKRHTARHVVSTPSVVLPGSGTPPPRGRYPDLGTPRGGT